MQVLTVLLHVGFPFSFSDIGSNNCGYYELQAVLTHQGRSSSSGHYVSWVKRKQGTEVSLAVA